jgi:PIN domain nuclease of toxin-antitoxin system
VRLLLDTHALLWWLAGDQALSDAAREAIADAGAAVIAADIAGAVASQGFTELPINIHKDLFDRMLIAQAVTADLVIVSNEALFNAYAVARLW